MATLKNTQARLFVGPTIDGVTARWIPGEQPLDDAYWSKAKEKAPVKRWLDLGWIVVDEVKQMSPAAPPPPPEDLAHYSVDELETALDDDQLPPGWAQVIKAEVKRRQNEIAEKKVPQDSIAEKLLGSGVAVTEEEPPHGG